MKVPWLGAARRAGAAATLFGLWELQRNRSLQRRFDFDPWHVRGNYYWTPYKAIVVESINALRPQTVIEVGCGLGDIICRVEAEFLLGVDISAQVTAAARKRHPNVRFSVGNLRELPQILRLYGIREVDVLVMVNWLHMLPTREVESALLSIIEDVRVRHLVWDAISTNRSDYLHRHRPEDFAAIGTVELVIKDVDSVRDLVVLSCDRAFT